MNFVDPKEYDIPGLVRKNRYKTILPSKFLLFKSLRQGGLFHMLKGFAPSRMHEVCCHYNVLSKGHIYEAAIWHKSNFRRGTEHEEAKIHWTSAALRFLSH